MSILVTGNRGSWSNSTYTHGPLSRNHKECEESTREKRFQNSTGANVSYDTYDHIRHVCYYIIPLKHKFAMSFPTRIG